MIGTGTGGFGNHSEVVTLATGYPNLEGADGARRLAWADFCLAINSISPRIVKFVGNRKVAKYIGNINKYQMSE